jgi:hypothetical protein
MKDEEGRYDVVSELASAPPGERERVIREVCARIAAARRAAPAAPGERRCDPPAPPPTETGPTLRSPPDWVARSGGVAGGDAHVAREEQSLAFAPGPTPPASSSAVAQPPAFLKSTAPLPDHARGGPARQGANEGALQAAPVVQPPQKQAAPRTVQSRVVGLGETAPVGDDSIGRAVAAVTSPVSLPALTLRQFASLCAEVAFQPERRSEILARYQVYDEAVYAVLDAYWRRERAARPEARTAFADDFASHLAWLHAHCR